MSTRQINIDFFSVCIFFCYLPLIIASDNLNESIGLTSIYTKEYIDSVGKQKDLMNANAVGIEMLKTIKSKAGKYNNLVLEQKKSLYVELNSSIDMISKKNKLGSGDLIVFSCISELRNLLALDLIKNSVNGDFIKNEFKNPEIDLLKLRKILADEFDYSATNKTLGQIINEICGFRKTSGTINDFLSSQIFNKNYFYLISHRDLKGFIYKYNEILISSAIIKLFVIMKYDGNMKIKICDKYSLFYRNMNSSQRELSGINTPKYISCGTMRAATSSLNSAIRNINSLGDDEWHDLLVAFFWKLSNAPQ